MYGLLVAVASLVAEHGLGRTGFSRCGTWTLEHRLSSCGEHGLSCPLACGIFLDQGLNLRPLHWQADSLPLSLTFGFWCLASFRSDQLLSPTLCNPMNHSTPGLPVHHQLPEFTQTHVHRVSDAIQPSHPLSSPSPSAPNPSQRQSLFQWVNSSHEVAKVLEFQL